MTRGMEDGLEKGRSWGEFPSYLLYTGLNPSAVGAWFQIPLRWHIRKCSGSWQVPRFAWKVQY